MISSLLLALALLLIFEGLFPFAFPVTWRETFRRIADLSPRNIRAGGFVLIVLGLLLLLVLR